MPLRTALVGFGLAGATFHAPLIAATEGLELSTVVTGNDERAAAARDAYPGVRIEATPEGVFERAGDHDLVVIASPNDAHAELAGWAIDLGLPVVVDKPLAPTSDEARGLVDRAEGAGVPLTVFQNRRWDSDFLTARRLIDDGVLGRVLRFESRFERWRPEPRAGAWRQEATPEEGGGLLLDLGAHLIDQALQLFGPVDAVHGEILHRRGGPADDDAFVALEHASGVRSHLWASDFAAAPVPRMRVIGTRAAFTVDALDGQEEALRRGDRPTEGEAWGVEPESRWGRLWRGEDEGEPVRPEPGEWPAFYRLLAEALTGEGVLPVDPRKAVEVIEIIERARRRTSASSASGPTAA